MRLAALVVAHGTVQSPAELPAFLRSVRQGRAAPPELVQELGRRYEAIGGRSPLLSTTLSVASKLEARLGIPVRAGMRLWSPFARDALAELVRDGARRVVVLPLAPYSTRVYGDAVRRAAQDLEHEGGPACELRVTDDWGSEPGLVGLFARLVREAALMLSDAERARTALLLTAHSLPQAVITAGDRYALEFERGARAVADRVRDVLPDARIAYQSEGAGAGPWLGPGLRTALGDIARERRFGRVLVAPVGFLADHVETLYDLDIEASGWARERGLTLTRIALPNDRDDFVEVLAALARPLFESDRGAA